MHVFACVVFTQMSTDIYFSLPFLLPSEISIILVGWRREGGRECNTISSFFSVRMSQGMSIPDLKLDYILTLLVIHITVCDAKLAMHTSRCKYS